MEFIILRFQVVHLYASVGFVNKLINVIGGGNELWKKPRIR